ncbi:Serine-arginine protein 55 [Eufriesea mexicana]|uniref:Serine-arginine protein 55 n=1 Tax=Eufriesea mexicana TaxID=516756 RepID=A0A310SJG6_9HYME|nr:Serine-arginine protein 55 [Eufriesea mexicana]
MSTRVFVGGLTYRYGRDKGLCRWASIRHQGKNLERFFRGYGRFRDVLIKNGYGFVEFDDYRDADDAVYELNGKELLGERVAVEIARGVSGRRGDRGYGRSRSWRDKITVERARGTPRGSDQWRYGDSRGGYGDSRRSARDDMRHDRDSVNRNTRTASSYKQSLPRYGPPTRTEYRLTVENLSSRVSWQDLKDYMRQAGEVTYADAHKQRRNEGVVEFATYSDLKNAIDKLDDTELNGRRIRLIEDKRRGRRSRSSRVVAAPVVVVDAAAVPNQGHIPNQNPNPNPNLLNVAELDLNPNQETAQSRNLSQSPNPDLVLGPRLRGQSPGRSPNPKPSLPRNLLPEIDLVAKDREATGRGPDQAANIAKAVAVLVHQ